MHLKPKEGNYPPVLDWKSLFSIRISTFLEKAGFLTTSKCQCKSMQVVYKVQEWLDRQIKQEMEKEAIKTRAANFYITKVYFHMNPFYPWRNWQKKYKTFKFRLMKIKHCSGQRTEIAWLVLEWHNLQWTDLSTFTSYLITKNGWSFDSIWFVTHLIKYESTPLKYLINY